MFTINNWAQDYMLASFIYMCDIFTTGLSGSNIYFDNVSNLEPDTLANVDLSNAGASIDLIDIIADY